MGEGVSPCEGRNDMDIRVTVDQIMDLDPCEEYTRARVTELFAGRESLTLEEILAQPIPVEDRRWVMARVVPVRVAVNWSSECARAVLDLVPEDEQAVCLRAIDLARSWSLDPSSVSLAALRSAALSSDAAWRAAAAAADYAVWSAAVAALSADAARRGVVWSAAVSAAYSRSAPTVAAEAAAVENQLLRLVRIAEEWAE